MSTEGDLGLLPLTLLLGRTVRSPQGEALGRLQDVVVRIGSETYPPITGLVLHSGNRDYFVPWAQVESLSRDGIVLASALVDLRPFARREWEILLARDLLDRKVIDLSQRRVVRANDVLVHCHAGHCRLAGVDVGMGSVARRLGVDRWLARVRPIPAHQVVDWSQVEIFATEVPVRLAVSHARTAELHPADIADMVDSVSLRQGHEILGSLDDETAADALEEMTPERSADLVGSLDDERAADILEKMEPDDAADLLADLPAERADDILERMQPEESEDVRELLQYEENTAGGIMTNDLVVVPRSFTAGEVLESLRVREELPEMIHYIYVVAGRESEVLVGVLPLRDLLVAAPERPLGEIMIADPITVAPDEEEREVARKMARYDLLALPVVGEEGELLGVVTVDDAMDTILPGEWKKNLPHIFR